MVHSSVIEGYGLPGVVVSTRDPDEAVRGQCTGSL